MADNAPAAAASSVKCSSDGGQPRDSSLMSSSRMFNPNNNVQQQGASGSGNSGTTPGGGVGGAGGAAAGPNAAAAGPIDRLRMLYPNVNEAVDPLPRSWSLQDKCSTIGLTQNNLRVHYKGFYRSPRRARTRPGLSAFVSAFSQHRTAQSVSQPGRPVGWCVSVERGFSSAYLNLVRVGSATASAALLCALTYFPATPSCAGCVPLYAALCFFLSVRTHQVSPTLSTKWEMFVVCVHTHGSRRFFAPFLSPHPPPPSK
uniref:Uncharacterized protein n=1 Tax=Anopheles melas TaxID=34690 RepID=A0A182UKY7_9DIPT